MSMSATTLKKHITRSNYVWRNNPKDSDTVVVLKVRDVETGVYARTTHEQMRARVLASGGQVMQMSTENGVLKCTGLQWRTPQPHPVEMRVLKNRKLALTKAKLEAVMTAPQNSVFPAGVVCTEGMTDAMRISNKSLIGISLMGH